MEFIVLDLNNATEAQLTATLECNSRTARLMSSEIEKLRRVSEAAQKREKQPEEETIVVQSQEKEQSIVDEDFENEVEYYYSQIKKLNSDNLDSEFLNALPARKNYQYERIMNRLKLESFRTIKEIKDFLSEEGLSSGEISIFKDDLELEFRKIQLLDKYLAPQAEEEKVQETKENNLIFVPTSGGGIRVLDEIDSMPIEYYDRFNGLFRSIKEGTFKNVKRFAGNSELAGLCEVRDNKVRVLFVRLNNDSYAIISAFIKKTDNDSVYRSSVTKKYMNYQLVENSLISNLANEEFTQLHKDYEKELFRKLSPSIDKAIPVVKKKSGDTKC